MSEEEKYTDREWLLVQRHAKLIAGIKKENANLKSQLSELAEAAENMLTLLVDNKPIEGLYLSSIEEWDCLIKEAKGE